MSKRESKAKDTEKEFNINPIKELPVGQRLKHSFYDDILDACMADEKNKIWEVRVKDKHWKSIYAPLDTRIMKKKYPLKIFIRTKEDKLYLKKYDSFEAMLKDRKIHKKKTKQ